MKRAYCGLVLSRELLDLVREQEQLWKQIEGVARARYAVGQGAQQDVLRVQVEVTRVEQLRAEQQAEARSALAELNRLLGRPAASPSRRAGRRLALQPVAEDLDALTRAAAPRARSSGAALAPASAPRSRWRSPSKEFKPDFASRPAT